MNRAATIARMRAARASAWILATSVVVSALAACDGRLERSPRGGAAADDSAADAAFDGAADAFADDEAAFSEADRTAAMEDRAEAARRRYDAAMAAATTDRDRIRAYEQFERDRLELNEMAETEAFADEGDAYPPPP